MCVLRISGKAFDPDAFAARTKMEVCTLYRRGELVDSIIKDGEIRSQVVYAITRAAWRG